MVFPERELPQYIKENSTKYGNLNFGTTEKSELFHLVEGKIRHLLTGLALLSEAALLEENLTFEGEQVLLSLRERSLELRRLLRRLVKTGAEKELPPKATVEALVASCYWQIRPLASQCGVKFEAYIRGKAKKVLVPTGFLQEILLGLVEWAIKRSPVGGKVVLCCGSTSKTILFTLEYPLDPQGSCRLQDDGEESVFFLTRQWLKTLEGGRLWSEGSLRELNRLNLEVPLRWVKESFLYGRK
ncbi:hypothetical protein [Ammonifex thiophilus]|uniref:Sensor histidine kinase n=1 Tax=Ammonifex thiophilus TaxID=444093 RepID=A0A3D8P5S7_9THEO|nr:hypothetical protein [Ammonifex thiophilus]RDV83662.1 hypothetical protein DXX99_05040 [Ammonifex thiophilus]